MPPISYLDFLSLTIKTKMVLTDSGGVQEETTALGIPCLTLRENTERPVTVTGGTNTLVGTDRTRIIEETQNILRNGGKKGCIPELWDGRASQRIVKIILDVYQNEKYV
jgi:UDP-N-acetylglucosamine 2-epimerase (non-hydrolysing)